MSDVIWRCRGGKFCNHNPGACTATISIGDNTMNPATQEIHPAPSEFTEEQLAADPILRYFHYAHLPPTLQVVSVKFFELAYSLISLVPRNAERTVALRKLLEAKDAAVRANIF